jgi:hypothetical protein
MQSDNPWKKVREIPCAGNGDVDSVLEQQTSSQHETERGPTMMITATTPFRGIRATGGTPIRVR